MKCEKWLLDPDVVFLNHGSFGACPRVVLDAQTRMRERLERQPVRFFIREMEAMLDETRRELGAFVGAPPDTIAFVPNATSAVNAVVRSMRIEAGDELLTTDHAYNACKNVLEYVAGRAGARLVVARVPFPVDGPERVVEAVVAAATHKTRLALVDHVTSPTGLVFPIEAIVRELAARGIDTLVDGAHAPGMLALDVARIGAAFYTGNLHKWVCAPKGAAFLHVRADRIGDVRPHVISHGANSPRCDRSRYLLEFDWTGTIDPTAVLAVPVALRFLASLHPSLLDLYAAAKAKALAARALLCDTLGVPEPAPGSMIGALASVPVPDDLGPRDAAPGAIVDPLQDALLASGIEVPVFAWPAPPKRLLRISAAPYNEASDFERLASALRAPA